MIAKLRSSKHVLFLVSLAVFLLATAAAPRLQEPATPDLVSLALQFGALAGAAALIAALVNVGKAFKIVPDGAAPTASLILNVIGLVVLLVFKVFKPTVDIAGLDQTAQSVAGFLIAGLGLATQLMTSRLVHDKGLKGEALLGTSHALAKGEVQA